MIATRVRAAKLTVVASLVAASALLSGTSGAGRPIKPMSIQVYAGQSIFSGAQVELFVGRVGERSYMEAILSVEAVPIGCPTCLVPGRFPVDIYVGAILPDGRFASWVGTPQAPTIVTGVAPVPLIVDVNLVEESETAVRVEFTATEPTGSYLLYGIVVKTGGAPFDPASWISTHFYPFLLGPAVTP
jgi:hypothetical protein